MKKKFFKNSLSGGIQLIFSSLLIFIALPIFIKMLGTERYGIFALLTVTGNINYFANLGINSSLIKYLAEQGKTQESDYDIIVSIIIILTIIIPLTFLIFFTRNFFLESVFNIPIKYFFEAEILFIALIFANIFSIIGQTFTAILDSQQLIYISNICQMIYNFFYWGIILVLLLLGKNLSEIGFGILTATFLWFLITGYFAFKEWGKIKVEGIKSNYRRIARKQISYGLKIYTAGIIGFFYEPFTKLIVSNLIGISEVGYFDIAIKIKDKLWGFAASLLYPLFPLIAQLKNTEKIKELISDFQQKYYLLLIPIVSIIFFVTNPFISLWIGHNVEIISFSVIIITSGYLIFSVSVIPTYHFMGAKDHAEVLIYSQLANVFSNFLFILFTHKYLGLKSAIIGNTLGILSSFILLNILQKKYLSTKILIMKNIFYMTILFIINFMTLWLINHYITFRIINIFSSIIIVLITTIFFFRWLGLFSQSIIEKYLDQDNLFIKSLFNFLLIKKKF